MSIRNNISRAEKIDEHFKIMVFNNREWLKVTDQPISKPGAYDGFLSKYCHTALPNVVVISEASVSDPIFICDNWLAVSSRSKTSSHSSSNSSSSSTKSSWSGTNSSSLNDIPR
ncbi:hypothetical protein RIR_jg35707.t1 [Rhizophagus irregularis DAOM 181602=DAOM 197198]|nr:hypothetical protein RIR_jg35707.t1 [Rhizophagus irregularis DAOM 181602=DAOM 197198]